MAAKSILEIEEARRRLEQMAKDHEHLAELINKLKDIRANLTRLTEDAQQKARDLEACLQGGKSAREELEAAVQQLALDSERAQTRASALQEELKSTVTEFVSQQKQEIASTLGPLRSEQQTWLEAQKEAFEEFRDRHHERLDEVSKAYERMRVAYDSIKVTTESMETALSGISDRVTSTQNALREEVRATVKQAGQTLWEHLSKAVTQSAASVDKKVRALEERVEQSRSAQDERLEQCSVSITWLLEKRKTQMRTMWVLQIITWAVLLILLILVLAT